MNDARIVVDASAVIALLADEPFDLLDPERVAGATISAVNLSEVLARLRERGASEEDTLAAINQLRLDVVSFDERQAIEAAWLRPATRRAGLSFGDRACLALGKSLDCPVVTADRIWATISAGVDICLIR